MFVFELIEALNALPQDAEVVVTEGGKYGDEGRFGEPLPHLMADGRVWVE